MNIVGPKEEQTNKNEIVPNRGESGTWDPRIQGKKREELPRGFSRQGRTLNGRWIGESSDWRQDYLCFSTQKPTSTIIFFLRERQQDALFLKCGRRFVEQRTDFRFQLLTDTRIFCLVSRVPCPPKLYQDMSKSVRSRKSVRKYLFCFWRGSATFVIFASMIKVKKW